MSVFFLWCTYMYVYVRGKEGEQEESQVDLLRELCVQNSRTPAIEVCHTCTIL